MIIAAIWLKYYRGEEKQCGGCIGGYFQESLWNGLLSSQINLGWGYPRVGQVEWGRSPHFECQPAGRGSQGGHHLKNFWIPVLHPLSPHCNQTAVLCRGHIMRLVHNCVAGQMCCCRDRAVWFSTVAYFYIILLNLSMYEIQAKIKIMVEGKNRKRSVDWRGKKGGKSINFQLFSAQ